MIEHAGHLLGPGGTVLVLEVWCDRASVVPYSTCAPGSSPVVKEAPPGVEAGLRGRDVRGCLEETVEAGEDAGDGLGDRRDGLDAEEGLESKGEEDGGVADGARGDLRTDKDSR